MTRVNTSGWRYRPSYYGSVIPDRLCFICLIGHKRGDKPVLPWLSRKNSGLLVRKDPLDTDTDTKRIEGQNAYPRRFAPQCMWAFCLR